MELEEFEETPSNPLKGLINQSWEKSSFSSKKETLSSSIFQGLQKLLSLRFENNNYPLRLLYIHYC